MATRDFTSDVYDYLDSQGYSNLVQGPLSFFEPDKAIAILPVSGLGQVSYLSGGSNTAYNQPGVQIRVRGTREKYSEAKTRAKNIEGDLNDSNPSGLVKVRKRGSFTYDGRDEEDRPIFNIEFIASYES